MKNVLNIMATLFVSLAASCADQATPTVPNVTVIDQTVLDSATVLVIDSTERRFDYMPGANQMLVYKDSILIVSRSEQNYGEPILSLYDRGNPLRHLGDYIPRGSDDDEMVACRIQIAGDGLFVSDCYYTGKTSVWNIAQMAADDYTDAENIKRVQDYHRSVVANYRTGDDNRFTRVWENMFLSGITSELFSDDSYAVAYKLNNGHTVIRYYSERDSLFDSYSSSVDYSGVDEIVASDTYYRNYSALLNAQTDEITSIAVSNKSYNDFGSSYSEGIHIEEVEGKVSEAQAASDRRKVMEAYRRDYDRLDGRMSGYLEEKTTNPSSADNDLYLHIRYTLTDVDTGSFLMNLFGSIITQYDKDTDMGVISPDCTETIQALQDVGVLDKDGKIDQNSVYYFKAKNIYEK